jgi:hypothetical protein
MIYGILFDDMYYMILYDIWYFCQMQLGWRPVAVVQCTFAHKQCIKQQK